MNDSSGPQVETNAAWRELQTLISQVGELARSADQPHDFLAQVLDKLVTTLAAAAGAVWMIEEEDATIVPVCQINLDILRDDLPERHAELMLQTARSGRARSVPPNSSSETTPEDANPSDFELFVAPIVVEGSPAGVIELVQPPGASPAAQRGCLQVMSTVAELVANYLSRRELAHLRAVHRRAQATDQFVDTLQQSLDVREIASHVVNDGRRLIACDRVTLLVRERARFVVRAVSGVADPDRRSNAVRGLERITTTLVRSSDHTPIWLPHESSEPNSGATQDYMNLANAKQVGLFPLVGHRDQVVAALVCENFTDTPINADEAAWVARKSRLALANAVRLRRSWLGRGLGRESRGTTRSFIRVLIGLVILSSVVLTLSYVRADFRIAVMGTLQPDVTRHIFAPVDGEVAELRVQHDDVVRADDLLLKLTSPALDLEFQRVLGEFETAQKRLFAVESARVRVEPAAGNAMSRLSQLSAEEEELKILLASKQRELDLLRQDREQLAIRSPIDGRVLTWDTDRRLANRPVRRGQTLLAVADTKGKWIVELSVPHEDIRYLLAAADETDSPVGVAFTLETDPSHVFRGTLRELSGQVQWDAATATRVVHVEADFDDDNLIERRPGAVVTANIDCGRRAAGYVWLHQFIDRLHARWMLFWADDSSGNEGT